jgi:hypothetical protein
MKISIDNLHGLGAVDYTGTLDASVAPKVERKINQPAVFTCALLGRPSGFVIPTAGARVKVSKESGGFVFTGYLTESPAFEYLGWGERGPVYRYQLMAQSDEVLLDQKALPHRAPFVNRSAGAALKQLAEDLLPGVLTMSTVEDLDTLAAYEVDPHKTFSYHAGEIARATRGSYRVMDAEISLGAVGAKTYSIDEKDSNFSPAGLKLRFPALAINEVTVIGVEEPQAYVRDYFAGDGLSSRFYLSQFPFQQNRRALIDEDFRELDSTTWKVNDPASAISVAGQALQVQGGDGRDGESTASFIEQIELGGAIELQHGDVSFNAASRGIIGGLYDGEVAAGACVAGFQVTPSGNGSRIQALIKGSLNGPVVNTVDGHLYALRTYIYCMEVYRAGEKYHSSLHEAGNGYGGAPVAANVRVVLQLQDFNPSVPASMMAPAIVLYDNIVVNAPGFCCYALVNAEEMHCSIAGTYVRHISTAEVRTALPDHAYATRLVESLSDGGECAIVGSTTLDFYPQYVPPLDTLIVASYRGAGPAVAQIVNTTEIAARQIGGDDGVRSVVRRIKAPGARTQTDCENAAVAILDDATGPALMGSYETWSDFLPGGAPDIFPGDGVAVDVPSQGAQFNAVVRNIRIELVDVANDRGRYIIDFANDLAEPLAMRTESSGGMVPLQDLPVRLATTQVGSYYLASLKEAQIVEVSSTDVRVDAGIVPGSGYGIEVRSRDFGWGPAHDRSLLGRFSGRTFTLPRFARSQSYFLRLYDSASPPRYSRYAAALHVDFPYA